MKRYIVLVLILFQTISIHSAIYYNSINVVEGLNIPIGKETKVRGITTVSVSPLGYGNEYWYSSFWIKYTYLTNSVIRNNTRLSETHKFSFGPGMTLLLNNNAYIRLNALFDINFLYDYYYFGVTTELSMAGEVYRTNEFRFYVGGQVEFAANKLDRIKMEINLGPVFTIEYRKDKNEQKKNS